MIRLTLEGSVGGAVEGVVTMASRGVSSSPVWVVCRGGVVNGSRSVTGLSYKLWPNKGSTTTRMNFTVSTHFGGVMFLASVGCCSRRKEGSRAREASFLSL